MNQAADTHWLVVGFLACLAAAVLFAGLAHFKKLRLCSYAALGFIGLASCLILSVKGLIAADDAKLRLRLKNVDPSLVSNIVVQSHGQTREVASTNQVELLLHELHTVKAVSAHHSYPTESYSVRFLLGRDLYQYAIARDSDRRNEYWLFDTARGDDAGREIGRINSTNLGQLLSSLASGQAPPH